MRFIPSHLLFLLFIYPIITLDCESKTTLDKCLNEKDIGNYPDLCCFLQPLFNSSSKSECITVPYSTYFSGYNREYKNGILYNVTCNETNRSTTFILEECGNINKKKKASLKNCKKYSTVLDSCCYYKGKSDNEFEMDLGNQDYEKGCYWLGSKYEGTINWAGAKLECNQNYLNYCMLYIFTFIFGIILF